MLTETFSIAKMCDNVEMQNRIRSEPVLLGRIRSEPVLLGRIRSEPVLLGRIRSEPVLLGQIRLEPVLFDRFQVNKEADPYPTVYSYLKTWIRKNHVLTIFEPTNLRKHLTLKLKCRSIFFFFQLLNNEHTVLII